MTFELYHINIRRQLIRAFALADEWIDHTDDHRLSNPEWAESSIVLLWNLAGSTRDILSSISDYRFFKRGEKDEDSLNHESGVAEMLFENISFKNSCDEVIDLNELRNLLRDQLFECLLMLELPDENKGCEVKFANRASSVDVADLCKAISTKFLEINGELDAAHKNLAM